MLIRAGWATFLVALALSGAASAQTPGEWRYSIATDMSTIPADMRANFPTITFSACRNADDFVSGRAFALQTLASSTARCPSVDFVRSPLAEDKNGKAESLRFTYACDEGKTLAGTAKGRVHAARFEIALESRYASPVGGVSVVKQTMIATRAGPCKTQPNADELSVK